MSIEMYGDEKEYKLVAPDIDRLIRYFKHGHLNPMASTSALLAAMEPLFEILTPLAPYKKNKEAKTIWLRIPRGTIEDYDNFEDLKEYGDVETYEEYVKQWQEDYPDEYNWYRLVVVKSLNKDGALRFYAMSLGNETIISATLEERLAEPSGFYAEEAAVILCELIVPAVEQSMKLLKEGKYDELVDNDLPYQFRRGVIKRSDFWETEPGHKEWVCDGLTEESIEKFKGLIESGMNSEAKIVRIKRFTANDFFKACKFGYEAIGKDCKGFSLSGLYMRYADGRDEGLTGEGHGLNAGTGIDFDDPKAWDEWYFNREQHGGHPWEVVPGGNSTHVELCVMHDKNGLDWKLRLGEITEKEYKEKLETAGYYFALAGVHRQFETVNFYLALSSAGLPVIVMDAEEMVARFDGSDYVGVVPHHVATRYCSELFPKKYGDIIDFTHVYKNEDDWIDKITWLPEDPALLEEQL